MSFDILETAILIFGLAVLLLIIMRRIHLPAIIGFLILGIIVGPHGFKFLESTETITLMAELGIVFLLFAIGLEVSLTKILQMKHAVLMVGGIQVLACTLIPWVAASFLGMSWGSAFVASAALSLSSTAIVVRQLAEQKELMSKHGELSLAMLLFQDLAAVPFLIIIPVLAGKTTEIYSSLGIAFIKGVIAIAVVVGLGHYILRPIFDEIAESESEELFMLASLLVALSTAWVTESLGLSMALGAFLAGLVLGETHHRHQIQKSIRPFRDLFLGLFFVTVGMLLNFHIIITYWYWVLFLVAAILVFKFIVISVVARYVARLDWGNAMQTGLILAHGGEFGFVLLALGMTLGLMERDYGQVVLAGVLITMFLCPILIRYNKLIADKLTNTVFKLRGTAS